MVSSTDIELQQGQSDIRNKNATISKSEVPATTPALSDSPVESTVWRPTKREALLVFTLSVNMFVISLDATIIVTPLATIAKSLHTTAVQSVWIGSGYLLPFAAVQQFVAIFSDILGRRNVLLTSLTLFIAGTVVCTASHNFVQLLAGRVVQGVGGGGMQVLANIVLTDFVPLRYRPQYLSYIQAFFALGTMFGPILGGVFVHFSTWRLIFVVVFPFSGLALVLIPLSLKSTARQHSVFTSFSSVNWMSGILLIGGLTSALIALTWAGNQFAWDEYQTVIPLAVGFASMVCAIIWDVWGTEKPFIQTRLFKNRSGVATYIIAICQGFILYGQLYYISLYLEGVQLLSPIFTGLGILAITLGGIPSTLGCGRLVTSTGHYRTMVITGCASNTVTNGLLILLGAESSRALWISLLALVGFAQGIVLASLQVSNQASASPGSEGSAAVMFTFMRSVGMAIGVCIGGTVFQNVLVDSIKAAKLPSDVSSDAHAYIATMKSMKASPLRQDMVLAFAHSLRGVFILLASICGFAFLVSLLIRPYALSQGLDFNQDD